MAEDLDDLLTVHHLFDVAVDGAEIFLLIQEILAALSGGFFCTDEHKRDHDERDERQRDVQNEHTHEDTHDRERAVDDLRDALADHLAQGIDVVRVHGHDIAVGMCVKVTDWQLFHMCKQVVAQIAQGSLCDCDHDTVISIGRDDTDCIKNSDTGNGLCERCKIRVVT